MGDQSRLLFSCKRISARRSYDRFLMQTSCTPSPRYVESDAHVCMAQAIVYCNRLRLGHQRLANRLTRLFDVRIRLRSECQQQQRSYSGLLKCWR